ncbi:MAG: hypothetical protein RDU14_04630 [Melioribacteraceae bacterium]|nr:hypothetical protein [Melioribacteraceae bacterium]
MVYIKLIYKYFCKGRIYSTLFLIVIFLFACSNKEEKLELFSPEAFTYSLEDGWELNASCRVKGFTQNENSDEYVVKLSYTVDLATPDGNGIEGIVEGLIDEKSKERFSDLHIETQLQIDESYPAGKYKIIFNVSDDFSQKKTSIEKEFELTKE